MLNILNLSRIPYEHEIAADAAAMRQHQAYGGKNIATICLTNGIKHSCASVPPGRRGVVPKHSEQAAWEALVASGDLKGITRIAWIYTERAPCGGDPGMRNCSGLVEEILKAHGESGLDTPVYFTYEYPESGALFITMLACQTGYAKYLERSESDKAIIRRTAPKLIEIGEYMLDNGINAAKHWEKTMAIARDLYCNYRDEAIVQLKQHDL